MCTPRGNEYSRFSPSSPSMKILRWPLVTSPYFTVPLISAMTAVSRGLRASNSSTTRGRPPVMSLVFVVSRGIFAITHHQVSMGRHVIFLGFGARALRAFGAHHDHRLPLFVRRVRDHELAHT